MSFILNKRNLKRILRYVIGKNFDNMRFEGFAYGKHYRMFYKCKQGIITLELFDFKLFYIRTFIKKRTMTIKVICTLAEYGKFELVKYLYKKFKHYQKQRYIVQILDNAIKSGNIDMILWLNSLILDKNTRRDFHLYYSYASQYNNQELVNLLYEWQQIYHQSYSVYDVNPMFNIIYYAIIYNNLDMVKNNIDKFDIDELTSYFFFTDAIVYSLNNNHIEIVKYFYDNIFKFDLISILIHVNTFYFKTIKWFLEENINIGNDELYNICSQKNIEINTLEILKYLIDNNYTIDNYCLYYAYVSEKQDVIDFIYDNYVNISTLRDDFRKLDSDFNNNSIADLVVNNIDLLKYLIKNNLSTVTQVGFRSAIIQGNLNIVRYLYKQNPNLLYGKNIILVIIHSTNIDVIKWYDKTIGIDVDSVHKSKNHIYETLIFKNNLQLFYWLNDKFPTLFSNITLRSTRSMRSIIQFSDIELFKYVDEHINPISSMYLYNKCYLMSIRFNKYNIQKYLYDIRDRFTWINLLKGNITYYEDN